MQPSEVILDGGQGAAKLRLLAVLRLVTLIALLACAFRPEVTRFLRSSAANSETAHAIAMPLAVGVILWRRRDEFAAALTRGSFWGVVFIAAGLALYAGATWPFSYGYLRDISIVPVFGGIVLVTCGWRVLVLSGGIVLLLLLAIPIGSRLYAGLIIHPETLTIAGVGWVLDLLPGAGIRQQGVDLFFRCAGADGVIALGESNRGAQLMPAYAWIGVFVTVCRRRKLGRLIFVVLAAAPIVLAANYFRLLLWGLVNMYGRTGPTEGLARSVSAVGSMLVAYVFFATACALRIRLFIEDTAASGGSVGDTGDGPNAR